jgi:hypothetical protein
VCTRDHGRSAPYWIDAPTAYPENNQALKKNHMDPVFYLCNLPLLEELRINHSSITSFYSKSRSRNDTKRTSFFCQGHQKVEELCSEYNSLQQICNTISHPNASKRYLRVQVSLTFTTGFLFCHLQKRLQAGTLQN